MNYIYSTIVTVCIGLPIVVHFKWDNWMNAMFCFGLGALISEIFNG